MNLPNAGFCWLIFTSSAIVRCNWTCTFGTSGADIPHDRKWWKESVTLSSVPYQAVSVLVFAMCMLMQCSVNTCTCFVHDISPGCVCLHEGDCCRLCNRIVCTGNHLVWLQVILSAWMKVIITPVWQNRMNYIGQKWNHCSLFITINTWTLYYKALSHDRRSLKELKSSFNGNGIIRYILYRFLGTTI